MLCVHEPWHSEISKVYVILYIKIQKVHCMYYTSPSPLWVLQYLKRCLAKIAMHLMNICMTCIWELIPIITVDNYHLDIYDAKLHYCFAFVQQKDCKWIVIGLLQISSICPNIVVFVWSDQSMKSTMWYNGKTHIVRTLWKRLFLKLYRLQGVFIKKCLRCNNIRSISYKQKSSLNKF